MVFLCGDNGTKERRTICTETDLLFVPHLQLAAVSTETELETACDPFTAAKIIHYCTNYLCTTTRVQF